VKSDEIDSQKASSIPFPFVIGYQRWIARQMMNAGIALESSDPIQECAIAPSGMEG
jgi:hypothetical protein